MSKFAPLRIPLFPQRFSAPSGVANHRPVWATLSHAVTTTDEVTHIPMATHHSIEKTYHYHRIIQLLKLEEPD